MNCKDFREISDSYLSNELLVETNHDVLRHLETCADCRELLAYRREVRERLCSSVKNAGVSRIDPAFSVNLKDKLRKQAFQTPSATLRFRLAFAGFAGVLMIAAAGFLMFGPNGERNIANVNPATPLPANIVLPAGDGKIVPAVLIEAASDAIEDHKNCALTHNLEENPISLEEAAKKVNVVNAGFDEAVMAALRETFGSEPDLIMAHYCMINGRYFTHVVLRHKRRTFSVLLTRLNAAEQAGSDPLICPGSEELSSACFSTNGYGLFVISDSSGSDNLLIAKTIFTAVTRHITKDRASV